jgi:hypothetical protein
VASAGIERVFVFAFYSLYSILPCGRQYRSAEKVSGAACCRRIARIVTARVHAVNERGLCKSSHEVEKFFALAILFCGAARIEERFLASPACGGLAGNGDSACQ